MKNKIIMGSTLLLLLSQSANAEFVTEDDVDNPRRLNFEYLPVYSAAGGTIQLGGTIGLDITAESAISDFFYSHFDGWGLNTNGSWGAPTTYIGHNDTSNTEMIIRFNTAPVSQVVTYINNAPGSHDLVITAYDSNMAVLESYNVTDLADISTPSGVNEGAFRGIHREVADIAAFGISGYYPVFDKLTFTSFTDIIFEDGFE